MTPLHTPTEVHPEFLDLSCLQTEKKITHKHATVSLAEVIRRLLFFDCFFKTLNFGLHMVIFILTYLTNSVFETGSGGTGNTLVICNFCYDLMAGNGSLCIYIYIYFFNH